MERCTHCTDFFKRYQCAKNTIGECDCPKCQGYCECYLLDDEPSDTDGDMNRAPEWSGFDSQERDA